MSSYIGAELRRMVADRAGSICEYCLIHERDTFLGCQVDHVISEKHGGATVADNLALACTVCNRAKGTDIGSVATTAKQFTRFFNPRTDHWADHFELMDSEIRSRTPIGEATAIILAFNRIERILERESLMRIGRYPPHEASRVLA
jgi:hypothetical protein